MIGAMCMSYMHMGGYRIVEWRMNGIESCSWVRTASKAV